MKKYKIELSLGLDKQAQVALGLTKFRISLGLESRDKKHIKNQHYTKTIFKNNGEITPDKNTNQNLIALAFSTNQTSQSPTLPARSTLALKQTKSQEGEQRG